MLLNQLQSWLLMLESSVWDAWWPTCLQWPSRVLIKVLCQTALPWAHLDSKISFCKEVLEL